MRRTFIVSLLIACFLFAGCKITGTVTDDGRPLSGVKVVMSGPVNKEATTNSKGEFSFTPFKSGKYTIKAESISYNFTPASETVDLATSQVSVRFEAKPVNPKALVLVNSSSAGYADYASLIKPVLDFSPAQMTVLDIAHADIGTAETIRAAYDVIIIGHRQIDVSKTYISAAESQAITDAVAAGVGLVNFDNDLTDETQGTPITFSCTDNSNQDPVITLSGLETIIKDGQEVKDNMWSEYNYNRPFNTLFAHTLESVPVMRLHKTVPNGYYKVYARLYNPGTPCKYYFGLSKTDPMDQSVDTAAGLPGEEYQHNWYYLDNVKVSSGEFNLYIQNAQYNFPYNYFFGWAEIRLVPITVKGRYQYVSDTFKFNYTPAANESHILLNSGYLLQCSDNDVQDPDVKVSTLIPDDNQWSEFTYNRPFATVFGYSTEFLPVLKFHKSGIVSGYYDVYANVYTSKGDAVYYYGWDVNNATGNSFLAQANTPAQKLEHTEYMLTNLYITESFNLFVQDAELSGTEPYYFGWAWVRLAPTDTSSINPIISEHKAADTIFTVDGTLKPVTMRMAGISAPSDKVLASTLTGTKKPVIAIATDETTGLVYAVQMGTYDWLGLGIMGYDDLILKSIDWASF